ncbi:MAG: hypothetical protein ACKVRO_11930 [Micropepsaceae bacterium]
MRHIMLLLVALGLAACAPAESGPTATPSNATVIPKDEQSCRVAGGTWRPVCMMGTLACVIKYNDAGKTCRDGDECQGRQCRYEGKERPDGEGREATGKCLAYSDPCGCFTLVEDGKIMGTLCAD